MKNLLSCAAIVALSGCASTEPVASVEDIGMREPATGSHITRRPRVGTADGVQSPDREAQRAQQPPRAGSQ